MRTETEPTEAARPVTADGRQTRWSLAGALAAAGVASICCLGPLVLVALGAGTAAAGSLAALEPYRPIFILMTAGFLAFAFYRTYRRPSGETCTADGQCTIPRSTRINRIVLWVLAPLILLLLASPYLVPRLLATQSPPAAPAADLEQVTLRIEGMTCPTCTVPVQRALLRVDGVEAVIVAYDPPEALVSYDPDVASVDALTEATADVGYRSTAEVPQ